MITAEQVAHYKTFGFLALREAFNPDEVAAFGHSNHTHAEAITMDRKRDSSTARTRNWPCNWSSHWTGMA